MTAAAFDTLQAARRLQQAGFDKQKAEALAEVLQQRGAEYATRSDVTRMEGSIVRIEATIAGLGMSINQLRNWFVSGLVTILVAIAATALLPV